MVSSSRFLLILAGLLAFASSATAVDVTAELSRERLPQGEDFKVRITVRNSSGRPIVHPPSVPGCRIELLKSSAANVPGGSRGSTTGRRSSTDLAPLVNAITRLESDAQRTLADQSRRAGLADPLLTRESQDLLRSTREQAMRALQGPGSQEQQIIFRITPERAGVLTLPSFIVEIGGRTYLTKPMEVTVEDSAASAGTSPASSLPPAAPAAPPAVAKPTAVAPLFGVEEVHRRQSPELLSWPCLLAGLLLPPVVGVLAYLLSAWRRHWAATAVQRQQRREAMLARRQLDRLLQRSVGTEDIGGSLSDYLRSRCSVPPGEVTPAEASQLLQEAGIATGLAEQFGEVLNRCAAARFAPGGIAVADEELAEAARSVVDAIEKARRWP